MIMPISQWTSIVLVILHLYVDLISPMKNHLHQNDNNLCNFTKWILIEHHVVRNSTAVLQKGSRERHIIPIDVVIEKDGKHYVNTTYIVEDCCIGFVKRGKKDKCEPSSIKSTQKSIDATPLQLGLGEFKSDRNTENNTFSSRVFYPLSTLSGERGKRNNYTKSVLIMSTCSFIIAILLLSAVIGWREMKHKKWKRNVKATVIGYQQPCRNEYVDLPSCSDQVTSNDTDIEK